MGEGERWGGERRDWVEEFAPRARRSGREVDVRAMRHWRVASWRRAPLLALYLTAHQRKLQARARIACCELHPLDMHVQLSLRYPHACLGWRKTALYISSMVLLKYIRR